VTGSGKTEVYFEAVAEALKAGRQGADFVAGNRSFASV
jgi:late competence protein required for DNA uptake (superfamily II DNA/RNA helicase)